METDERKEAGRGRGLHMAVSEKGFIENCKRAIQKERVDDRQNVDRTTVSGRNGRVEVGKRKRGESCVSHYCESEEKA